MLNYIKDKVAPTNDKETEMRSLDDLLAEVSLGELSRKNDCLINELFETKMTLEEHIYKDAKEDIENYIKLKTVEREREIVGKRINSLEEYISELHQRDNKLENKIKELEDKHNEVREKLFSATYNHDGLLLNLGRDIEEVRREFNGLDSTNEVGTNNSLEPERDASNRLAREKILLESNKKLNCMKDMANQALEGELGEPIRGDLLSNAIINANRLESLLLVNEKDVLAERLIAIDERLSLLKETKIREEEGLHRSIDELKKTVYIKPSFIGCPHCDGGSIRFEESEVCSVCKGTSKLEISFREQRQREKLHEVMLEDYRAGKRKSYL